MPSSARFAFWAIALALLAANCGAADQAADEPAASAFDPVEAGEVLPDGFRQLLDRDRILPVYEPTFVAAGLIDWRDDSLVIGVDIDGDARAYPVAFLTRREMVIDNHRGIPTLVTW